MFAWMQKTAQTALNVAKGILQPVGTMGRGGWNMILEAFPGAWQRNIEVRRDGVVSFYAIFACVTLIASDMAKMRFKKIRYGQGVWSEVPFDVDLVVLDKPNSYQTALQFREAWLTSKMVRGNAYIYLVRTGTGRIKEMHVLNPDLVLPLVSEDGEVFYQLGTDNLAGIAPLGAINVPSRYIIHDRFNCLFHPLVGLPPIFAAGIAAVQGLNIQKNSALFFENMSRPSGILSVPGSIGAAAAKEMKESWETSYGPRAENNGLGKTAVLGDGVKYEAITISAKDAEMVDQLRMTAEVCCSAYHVPKHKVGVGDPPSYNNIESLDLQYLSQCLHVLVESMESLLNEAFDMEGDEGIELDLDMLLRMDSKTKVESLKLGVDGGIYTPNEARRRMDLPPLKGGDTVYMQQQNYPIEALANREPPAENSSTPSGTSATPAETPAEGGSEQERAFAELAQLIKKEITA